MNRNPFFLAIALGLITLLASHAVAQFDNQTPDSNQTSVIHYDSPQQVVDGFGFSTAWGNVPGTPANEDAFFSTGDGAGFSILRNRIPFNQNPKGRDGFIVESDGRFQYTPVADEAGSYKNFQLNWDNWDLAKTRDLIQRAQGTSGYQLTKVFSTPWTPPNNATERWKLPTDPASQAKNRLTEASYGTSPEVGGYLDPAHYQDYADLLADYVIGFKQHMGCDLYALSLQNEPSFDCGYESCDWSAQQIHNFLLVLKNEFIRKGVQAACPNIKIIAPESNNFSDALLSTTYADPATRNIVGIAAGHQYEYGPWSMGNSLDNLFTPRDGYHPDAFDPSFRLGRAVWMTEWSMAAFSSASMMDQALVLARVIHMDFTQSHLNAFVFWWSATLLGESGEGKGLPTKNLWAIAQFSRLVRPGWRVLPTSEASSRSLSTTAFADPRTGQISVVIVNAARSEQTLRLQIAGINRIRALTLFRTSATQDMAPLGSVAFIGSNAVVHLPPASISTYFGEIAR